MAKDIDMSMTLEQHIKQNKGSKGSFRGRRGRGGRGGKSRQPIFKRGGFKSDRRDSFRGRGGRPSRGGRPARVELSSRNNTRIERSDGRLTTSQGGPRNYKRLIVSNLPINATNDNINELFGAFGPLNICKIKTDKLGKSFGIAIVEYKAEEHAKKAIQRYNGATFDRETIKIAYDTRKGGRSFEQGRITVTTRPTGQRRDLKKRIVRRFRRGRGDRR